MISRIFAWGNQVSGKSKKLAQVLAVTIALLWICNPLFSQSSQSAIEGAVYDQSHAVIAGASVTVIDVARGAQRALVTDSAGAYGAANLIPGTYTVRAQAKGFQTVQQANVVVETGQTIRVDLTLTPGEQNQTITVTSEAPAVDTADAQFGGEVSNDLVNSLPLNGRDFQRLVELHPGIVATAGNGTGVGQVTNGRKSGDDLYRVEGVVGIAQTAGQTGVLNGTYRSGDTSSLLPIDAIQEFNTLQNPKAAEGWKEGSTISIAVKSGTNTIHGTAYAFGRNAGATDAPNYFTGTVTPATLEQFGATAGGRILKDKLFWFAGYEGLRDTLGDTAQDTVPVDVSLAGVNGNGAAGNVNVSMVDACKALGSANINPLSARISGLNPTTCVVTPASSTVENLFPYVTNSGGTYNPPLITNGPLNNGVFKLDYIPGPHHHISGTYFEAKSAQLVNQTNGELASPAPLGNGGSLWEVALSDHVEMYTGSWTWVPNSTWVNDFRLGNTYFDNFTLLNDGNIVASNTWPTGYALPTGVTNPAYGGMPEITFGGFNGILGSGTRGPSERGPEGSVDLVDNVSYLHGKHAFKFGFEFVDILYDGNPTDQSEGMIAFNSLEQFLQGQTLSGTILEGNPKVVVRGHWYSGYFQDDWRIRPKVTLNLGLRYEYYGQPLEQNNYLGNFDPNVNPATTSAIQQIGPGGPFPSIYNPEKYDFSPRVGVAWDVQGNGKTVVRSAFSLLTDFINMQNAVASAPFGATVFGGTAANPVLIGANMSGTVANAHTPDMPSYGQDQLDTGVECPGVGATCGWNTTGPIFPAITSTQTIGGVNVSGLTCTPSAQCTVSAVNPKLAQPRAAEWTLDIQRAITNSMAVDIAYVGNYGFHEALTEDLNQAPLGAGWTAAAAAACGTSPTFNCKANAATECGQFGGNGVCANGSTFPYINFINQSTYGASSDYNALQVILSQRVSHGLSFLAGFTYAHSLDDAVSKSPAPLSTQWATGSSDIKNRFTISPSYLVPGFKTPGQMLEGWSVSALITLQSGQPWYPTDTTTDWLGNGEKSNGGTDFLWNVAGNRSAFTATKGSPNPLASPFPCYDGMLGSLPGCTTFANAPASIEAECLSAAIAPYAPGVNLPGTTTSLQSLATAAFENKGCYLAKGGILSPGGAILTPPAYGTIGDANRNIFRGPGYYNVDLSIAKIWKFRERYSAQFRAEFFNLFNHTDLLGVPGNTNPEKAQFGCACSTPDSSTLNPNPVLGSGGPRHIQFGLKLIF